LLGFLLFAGALEIDLAALKRQRAGKSQLLVLFSTLAFLTFLLLAI